MDGHTCSRAIPCNRNKKPLAISLEQEDPNSKPVDTQSTDPPFCDLEARGNLGRAEKVVLPGVIEGEVWTLETSSWRIFSQTSSDQELLEQQR